MHVHRFHIDVFLFIVFKINGHIYRQHKNIGNGQCVVMFCMLGIWKCRPTYTNHESEINLQYIIVVLLELVYEKAHSQVYDFLLVFDILTLNYLKTQTNRG